MRTPMAAVRAPKPLIVMGDEAAAPAANEAGADEAAAAPSAAAAAASSEPITPLCSATWLLRKKIDAARDKLIELRVHASSQAVMSPEGQQLRKQMGENG